MRMTTRTRRTIIQTIRALVLTALLCVGASARNMNECLEEGIQAYNRSECQRAIAAWTEGLRLAEKAGNKQAKGDFLGNLGLAYSDLGQYDKAKESLEQALAVRRKIGDVRGEGNDLTNFGKVCCHLGQYDKAREYSEKALAIARKTGDREVEGADLTNLGSVCANLAQCDKAREYFEQALAIAREIGDVRGQGRGLTNLGVVCAGLGQYDKAREYYEQALAIDRKIGDVKGEGADLTNLGVVYRNLGQHNKAREYYEQALAIDRRVDDVAGEETDLSRLGSVCADLGQYDKARECFEQALAIARKIGDVEGEGANLTNLGLVYWNLGEYDKAREHCEQALVIDRKIGDVQGEGDTLTNLSLVCWSLGQYDKAQRYCERALTIHHESGSAKKAGYDLNNLGLVCADVSQYDKAREYFERALAIHGKAGDAKGEGDSLSNLGVVHESLGQYDKAREYYEQALTVRRKIGYVKGEGTDLMNLGNVSTHLGQYDKAWEYYQQALAIARRIGDVKREQDNLSNLGRTCRDLGQSGKARECFERALAIARRIGDVQGEGANLMALGAVCADLDQHDKAREYYKQALAIHHRIGDVEGEGVDLTAFGALCGNLGQYDKAREYSEQALAIARRIGYVNGEGLTLNNLGFAALCAGRPKDAAQRLEEAASVYETIRAQVRSAEERTAFQSTLPRVYANLAATRLTLSDPPGAFEALERGRAKSFLDLLATAERRGTTASGKTTRTRDLELQLANLREKRVGLASAPVGEKTRSARTALDTQISDLDRQRLALIEEIRRADPEQGSLVAVDPPRLSEIQTLLGDATLVEYWHPAEMKYPSDKGGIETRDELWVFIVRPSNIQFRRVPVRIADLTKALEHYTTLSADRASDKALLAAASATLYAYLISPIEKELSSAVPPSGGKSGSNEVGSTYEPVTRNSQLATPLLLVPWGPMFKIPFASLAPAGGPSLGERRPVVVAPSAGVLRYQTKKRASGRASVFALGNPETADMVALPGAEREAKEIARLFQKSNIRLRAEATESALKGDFAALGPGGGAGPDVVHLACHGIFSEAAPQLSHLALTPDRANDGKLEMHEIFGLDWKGVSLVTLSACSSGKGKLGAGDDLVGLVRGFMFAGAPSVLCSLWDVDDEATRALMTEFYKNYLAGKSRPEALRLAQAAMRSNPAHPDWSHPYYWSAFVLFGDWE